MLRLIESLETRQCFAAAGSVDAAFNGTGLATVTFQSTDSAGLATPVNLLVDHGGRSYVVAYTNGTVQVARIGQSGQRDSGYAKTRGLIKIPVPAADARGSSVAGLDAALDPADRLYVLAGDRVYRFTVSGKSDPTFGKKGVATLSGLAGARDIEVDAANKIYVAGSLPAGTSADGKDALYQFAVARLRFNGSYDRTFGRSGINDIALPGAKTATNRTAKGQFVRVLDDGSVVAVAAAAYHTDSDYPSGVNSFDYSGAQAIKFDATGAIDATYGTNGVARYFAASGDITFSTATPKALRGDGSIVLNFQSITDNPSDNGTSAQVLLNTDGTRQSGGYTGVSIGGGSSFFRPDGTEIVASGSAVARNRADGTADSAFHVAAPGGISRETFAAPVADGTILIVGAASRGLSLNVRRVFNDAKPVADLSARTLNATGAATFGVTYHSAGGFDAPGSYRTPDGSELRVVKPDGTRLKPRAASVTALAGNAILVTYRVTDGGDAFTRGDNGAYAVKLLAGQIDDSDGQYADARTLGTFDIAIG